MKRGAIFWICAAVLSAASATCIAVYLHYEPVCLVALALVVLMILALRYLSLYEMEKLATRREAISIGVFALLLDGSLVLGRHIVITADPYTGLVGENYISQYSWSDVGALALMLFGLYVLLLALYRWIASMPASMGRPLEAGPIRFRGTLLLALLILVFWFPYLVVYWPGFIFSDSISSLIQSLHMTPYTNHFPIFYTLFIEHCMKFGRAIGVGNTGGIAIYSLVQMSFFALTISYMARWIVKRGSIGRYWAFIISAFFAIQPYFATLSIAVWKDVFFSCCLVLITLMLTDLVISKGEKTRNGTVIAFFLISLVTLFSRNNGIFIVIVLLVAFTLYALLKRGINKLGYSKPLAAMAAAVVIYVIVTGPVYQIANVVPANGSEAAGLPLNQMARVAAVDGEMSDDDRDYLDSILPIDKYPMTYRPLFTDLLKWDPQFDNEMYHFGGTMMRHWASMLAKNPQTYFEAWELLTFGFWTINYSEPVNNVSIIREGIPRLPFINGTDDIESLDIHVADFRETPVVYSVFPIDTFAIPIGILLWVMLYLALCLSLRKRSPYVMALLPVIALMATLLISTPAFCQPRYALALQMLIPYLLFMFSAIRRKQLDVSSITTIS